MRTESELKKILAEMRKLPAETEWLEFKEAKNGYGFSKLGRYFSALSNEANLKGLPCAWLVFGVVDKNRDICGSQYRPPRPKLDKLKYEIAEKTNGRITFTEIYELTVEGKRVVMFEIPAAPPGIPTSWEDHYYGRDGRSIGALSLQELDQIRGQASATDWSAERVPSASLDDLDKDAIVKAREEFAKKRPDLTGELEGWDDVTFLNKAKLTIQQSITNACLVLLGRPESEPMLSPALATMCWRLNDESGQMKDYEHFGPPLILQVDKLFARVRNLRVRHLPDGTLFPIEVTQYDPWVIREALHNCIAHQDYTRGGRVNVVESPSELTFSNLGGFIPGSVENAIARNAPPERYRNPFLAHAMVNLGMIDTMGSGIPRMFDMQRQRLFPMPDYRLDDPARVEVGIPGRIFDARYTQLLIAKADLDLQTVILLDKVQKGRRVSRDEHAHLKKQGVVEGRYPNLYVASHVASAVGDRARYIKTRGLDEEHYMQLVVSYLEKFGKAKREDIDQLLMDKLPDALSEKQKKNKINKLLSKRMRLDLGLIERQGPKKGAIWVLKSAP